MMERAEDCRRLLATRRDFLCAAALATTTVWADTSAPNDKQTRSLAGVIGITTGGLNYQREQGILTIQTLPRFVRDELGMQLIDLNTRWLASYEPNYLGDVRGIARDAGCYFTNLKVNHKFGDLNSKDERERSAAMGSARQLVEAASALGTRWIRFGVPKTLITEPADAIAHRQLAKYAQQRGLKLVVENSGWLASAPDSVSKVVKTIGNNTAPAPDTGNWNDDVRYEGLAKTFPGAVTCDFKVFDLDDKWHHAKYDIRRCFDIGWNAGFRGPWAIEHWNDDTKSFARETVHLRDVLQRWMGVVGSR